MSTFLGDHDPHGTPGFRSIEGKPETMARMGLMSRRTVLGLGAGALAVTLVGCTAPKPTPKTAAANLSWDDPNVPTVNIMTIDATQTERAASKMDPQDNPYSRYIFKHTGIKVKLTRVPDASYDTQVQLTLTGGGNGVDYLAVGYASAAQPLAQAGALEPLNQHLDAGKYPHFSKVYNSQYWKLVQFSNDKNIIASLNPLANQNSMLIRQDWLDATGLPMPKTPDDLFAAAKAFVGANPDGAKPVFGASGRQDLSNLLTGLTAAYGNPSAEPENPYEYLDKKHKKIVSWNTSDAAKAFYTDIQRWWKAGLIDKEALLNQGANWWDEISNSNFGIVSHQSISVGWLTDSIRSTLKKKDPTLVIVPSLKGSGHTNEDGNTEIQEADPLDLMWGFPRGDTKNIDAILRLLDWQCSPEGLDFTFYGVPGVEFDLNADGTKKMTPERSAGISFLPDYVFTRGSVNMLTSQMYADYVTSQSQSGAIPYDSVADCDKRVQAAVDYDKKLRGARPAFPTWSYSIPKVEAQTEYADYGAQMTALWVQMIQGKYDASTDSGWKQYLSAVDATGYNKVIQQQSAWLKKNRPALFR